MKPVRTDETNFVYELSGGTKENDLPCRREDGKVFSVWESIDMDALSFDAPQVSLFVWYSGNAEFECSIKVGDGPVHDNESLEFLSAGEGVWEYVASLSEREAQVLRDGGHVEVMVSRMPPPPIGVSLG